MTAQPDSGAVLPALREHVRETVTALLARPDSTDAQTKLVDLAGATDRAAELLADVAPAALAALRRALDHGAGRPEECASELVAAHHHLSAGA
ncbi:hypothetical protein [Saccharopolyspora hordei]|uniref:Uncharacterized protein n=1 Tax=Saccharopolyspora hordei TaxID=1838 RepID=A0A853AHQ9_9PSEU|nr:hypothetical protein [Saccharopolyspora hordei]NYI84154.1 hypothetical protein [Saccharopolyspora hordei]